MEPKFQNFSEGVNPENPRLRRSRKCLRHPKYCAPPCFLAHVNFAVSPCSWANIKRSALTAHWLVLSTLDLDFLFGFLTRFPTFLSDSPSVPPFYRFPVRFIPIFLDSPHVSPIFIGFPFFIGFPRFEPYMVRNARTRQIRADPPITQTVIYYRLCY